MGNLCRPSNKRVRKAIFTLKKDGYEKNVNSDDNPRIFPAGVCQ